MTDVGVFKAYTQFSNERKRVAKHFRVHPLRLLPPPSQYRDGSYRYLDVCTYRVFGYNKLSRQFFTETLDQHKDLWSD